MRSFVSSDWELLGSRKPFAIRFVQDREGWEGEVAMIKSAFASAEGETSGDFVDQPVFFRSADNDEHGSVRLDPVMIRAGRRIHGWPLPEDDRKLIAARSEFATTSDFVGLLGMGCGEESRDAIGAGAFAELIAQEKDAGFLVMGLPGVQKVVGHGEGGDVVLIGGRGRLDTGVERNVQQNETGKEEHASKHIGSVSVATDRVLRGNGVEEVNGWQSTP
jgi:hypothetical protein